MTRRRLATLRAYLTFKGRQFAAEVILWAVRWCLMFPISYRDLVLMLQERGVDIAHTTIFQWIQPMRLSWIGGSGPICASLTDRGGWMRPTSE